MQTVNGGAKHGRRLVLSVQDGKGLTGTMM
jgi:hypothetical protein